MNARERGNSLLHTLELDFATDADVTAGRMFNGEGLATGGKIFVFVSNTGRLVVKVPASEVHERIANGAEAVTMGKRTMREWVSIAQPADDDLTDWREAAESARRFVRGGAQST